MSVTAAEGFVAAGCHAGIKQRSFDMALLATDDRQPVPCAAVFTQNKFAAPPVELDRATLAANGGRRRRSSSIRATPMPAPARPGYKDAQLMAAAAGEALQHRQLRTCWSARPGSSARRCRWTRSSTRRRSLRRSCRSRAAHDAARGHPHHRPQAQGGRDQGLDLHARRHGQGLRHDRAQHGDDARLPDHRRRRAARGDAEGAARPRRTRPSTRSTSTARPRPTTPRCCSPRAGAARPIADEFANAVLAACRRPDDADGARRRGHDADGARSPSPAPPATPKRGSRPRTIVENNLVKCSWYGGDPYWGRLLAAAGSAGVELDVAKSRVAMAASSSPRAASAIEHDGAGARRAHDGRRGRDRGPPRRRQGAARR